MCVQNTNLQGCQQHDLQKEDTYLSVLTNNHRDVEKINTGGGIESQGRLEVVADKS